MATGFTLLCAPWSRGMEFRELTKGIIRSNPLFVIVLGVCPKLLDLPKPLRGFPIAFVCTGLMALASLGFAGMA